MDTIPNTYATLSVSDIQSVLKTPSNLSCVNTRHLHTVVVQSEDHGLQVWQTIFDGQFVEHVKTCLKVTAINDPCDEHFQHFWKMIADPGEVIYPRQVESRISLARHLPMCRYLSLPKKDPPLILGASSLSDCDKMRSPTDFQDVVNE